MKLRKYIKLRRDGALVIVGRRRVYKIALRPYLAMLIRLEREGNCEALKDPFWQEMVIPVKRIPFGLVSPRGNEIPPDDPTIPVCIESRLLALESHPTDRGDQVVDHTVLDYLASDPETERRRDRLMEYLADFRMPLSSTHGDFHRYNFVSWEGKLRIVDWDKYRRVSSFLLDAVHFHVIREAIRARRSWVDIAFHGAIAWPSIRALAWRFQLDPFQLISAYGIHRVSIEGHQVLSNRQGLPERFGRKYHRVYRLIEERL